ncbi:MAG TPA: TonB-dependent receptor [Niabella sp.]|nr:TonB-dependent receptor [Niabella sp.]HQX20849.1 TonB-dependent receptor [Niabella sp.]HQX41583.1 TonB-dependent receptor [Niabella sp.]HRB37259.1 TonB-dependent receptor [Niabella sp.]HRB44357.1 TonB-dependent receptor [Niabella sp.]
MQQSSGTSLLDVVAKAPGVSIVSTGPAIAKPVIRGLGYNRVVTINDGIRQEGQQWGDEHGLEVDEYSAQKIELLRGPSSLMYGSDAIGGVINIMTNVPIAINTIQTNISGSFNANNGLWGQYANVAGNLHGFSWNVYGSNKSAEDYKNKFDGQVLNSRYKEKNFGGYLGLNKSWGFSHFIFSQFNQNPGIVEGERGEDGNFVLDGYDNSKEIWHTRKPLIPNQSIQHTKFALDNSFYLKDAGRLGLLLGFQQNKRKEFGSVDDPKMPDAYFDLQTLNYNAVYHLPEFKNWKTSVGINGMQQQNSNKADEALIPDYQLFDFGLYSVVSKTFAQTTISGGLRFDSRNISSNLRMDEEEIKFERFKKRFSNFSASMGLSHTLNELILIKANLSRGFRAPNISELAANGEHEGTNRYELGDRNLISELSTAFDIGLQINTDHVSVTFSPFINKINNFIFYNKLLSNSGADSLTDGIATFRFNQQNATMMGIEAMLDIHPHPLDWLHFENTFSFIRGRFSQPVDGSRNLPLIAPASLLTELRADIPRFLKMFNGAFGKLEVNTVATQHKYFSGFDTETATKGYVLLNLSMGTDVEIAGRKILSLYVAMNNIGNVAYQSHLSRLKYASVNEATGRQGVFNMGRNLNARIIIPFSWNL